jgi:hypothetical protein
MKFKGGDIGAGIGAGGGGAAPPTTSESRQEFALNDTAFQGQAHKQMASSAPEPAKADAAKEEKERSFATKDGSGFGGYGRAAGADASAGHQQQQREADAFAESKSQANASQPPAAAATAAPQPAPSQPTLAEPAQPTESPLAAATPAPEPTPAPSAAPPAEIDAAKRAEIPSADQITLAPAPASLPPAPSGGAQAQRPAAIDETVALQQQQGQQQSKQFDDAGQPKLFIARGVTRQQLSELNSVIVSQNRVSNYSRAGGTITPTTVPAAVAADLTLQQQQSAGGVGGAYAMADKSATETPARRLEELSKLGTQPTAAGVSAAATPEASDTTVPAEKGALNVDRKQLDVAATTSPSTAPAIAAAPTTSPATISGALTTQPATDEERLDVVFLVQSEAPLAVQMAAPNAAAIEPATTPATTTSTAPAATSPSSAPAAR